MRVVINSGHFVGIDSGAVGCDGREADIVKYVAGVVVEDLKLVGIDAVLVANDDLGTICSDANAFEADLFVSIHCNSAENKNARGTDTFYYKGSSESKRLAGCIQRQLVDTMGSIDRGIKDGSHLYVLKHTTMPAVLTELGFISNKQEEIYLNEHKRVMAHAIARGITDYLSDGGN